MGVLIHHTCSVLINSQKRENLFYSHISDAILISVLITDTVEGSVIVYDRINLLAREFYI